MIAPTSNYGCGVEECIECYGDKEWRDSQVTRLRGTNVVVKDNDSVTVHLPGGGLVLISNLTSVGSTVAVYADPSRNPLTWINLREADEGSET